MLKVYAIESGYIKGELFSVYGEGSKLPQAEFECYLDDNKGNFKMEDTFSNTFTGLIEVDTTKETIIVNLELIKIDKSSKYKIILISDLGPSDDYTTKYYLYSNGSIDYLGETQGLYDDGIVFSNTGNFEVRTRAQVLQTWFLYKTYKLNFISKEIVEVQQDTYETNYSIFVIKQFSTYESRDLTSQKKLVKSGQIFKIIKTDNKEWHLVQFPSGKEGWFYSKGFSMKVNNSDPINEVFYGLCFAD